MRARPETDLTSRLAHEMRVCNAVTFRAKWWLILLGLLVLSPAAQAVEPPPASLVARARELGIAQSLEWHRLLHYRRNVVGDLASEVDGAEFFLAPNGKQNPEAELEATLNAFLLPMGAGSEDTHALCRFPARRRLLDDWLHFEGVLRDPICPALSRYMSALDPDSVAIVYSANYLNNPASAFGHTFLRISKRRPPGTTEREEARDHGVDFLAATDTNNPLLYAWKGVTGMFPGFFQIHSYAYKVREYGNLEARDLWEYELALRATEVQLLTLHLWELSKTHLDYYYMTRNCSYEVLELVDAAVPRIDLVSHLKFVVLPKDTVQTLFKVNGLVRQVSYRPSLRSRFRAQVANLGSTEKDSVERLTLEPSAPLPAELSLAQKVATLDTAVFVLDARFARQLELTGDAKLVAARALLVERRGELSPSIPLPPAAPAPTEKGPDRGPGVMRVTIGSGGTTQYGSGFETLGYRLALHDLADPPDGEPELSQLQFLDTRLRYDLGRQLLTLDRLTFADVVALNPITRYEKAFSWRMEAFGMRLHDRGCLDCFAHGLDLALGGTIATPDEHVAFFVMADTYVAFSGALDGIGGSFVRIGVGPYAGLRAHIPGGLMAVVTGGLSYLPGENLRATYDVRASVRRPLAKNVALGFEGAAQPAAREAQLDSYFFF